MSTIVGGEIIQGGLRIEGGIPRSVNPFANVRLVPSGVTIQSIINVADPGDIIAIAPGDYDEAVVINADDNLTLVGLGARGAVAIAPSDPDEVALTIDGTTGAGRIEEVTLVNIGCEGNGTGGGLHIKGNIRRIRIVGSKLEGGAFGAKLESTGEGSVGDTRFEDCEFAWTTSGLHILSSGGGDPVTQTYVRNGLFHNCAEEWVLSGVSAPRGLWVEGCVFAREEDASTPVAGQIDAAVVGSEGIFANNYFALATMSNTPLVIATGILWVGNVTEAGVGGRPA